MNPLLGKCERIVTRLTCPLGVWFVQIANNFGANHEYTDEQKSEFRDPYKIVEHAKSIEDQVNGLWGSFYKNSKAQAEGQVALKARMAEMIKDERLLKGYTPTFGIGCRRITPGDPYMEYVFPVLVFHQRACCQFPSFLLGVRAWFTKTS